MKLVYDIKSLPQGLDPGNLTKIYEQHHLVYWDSSKGGTKPQLYGDDDKKSPLMIVDLEGQRMNVARYAQEFSDNEFWDKELHNCRNSPMYFWANYGTPVYPHIQEDLKKYLTDIGLIDIVEKDSEKAKVLWEKQKAKIKKVTDKYTIEFLKERKAAIDALKAEYDTKVASLETLVKEFAKLFDSTDAPIADKKRITVLTEKISRHYPILPKYRDIYRNKKGKWDRPMLFNTSYGILLEMFYDVLVDQNRIEENVDGPAK